MYKIEETETAHENTLKHVTFITEGNQSVLGLKSGHEKWEAQIMVNSDKTLGSVLAIRTLNHWDGLPRDVK